MCIRDRRVGRVHELAGDEGIRDLLCQLVGLGNGTLHALGTLAQHLSLIHISYAGLTKKNHGRNEK